MEILLTKEAKSDLGKISDFLREKVIQKISYLERFPRMGFKMQDTFKGFRCLLAGNEKYQVIYKTTEKQVIIYYIRHSSRQIHLRLITSPKM